VDLYLLAPADRHFVVVNDPVPGGLEPVNRDLATTAIGAAIEDEGQFPENSLRYQFSDWLEPGKARWGFYHRELGFDNARFYSEFLPQGHYHLSYVAQAIAPGEFTALPPRAEEMYAPEVFGKGGWSILHVEVSQ
jgi:uncharacterized protein YfaS (alpha-2-macroglobulin family)